MSFERNVFERHGFKIDKDRVLTYSQLSCPLDCKYCFVDDMNSNQEKGVAYLTEEQLKIIGDLPEEIKLIMLGCDTEFFQHKEESLKILERIAQYKKDISVITKLPLSKDFVSKLKNIDLKLKENGNMMTFSVSLTSLDSAKFWEPHVPSPDKRIETLKNVYNSDIKTMVAIRPLLPAVPIEEIEELINKTKDYSVGYYSGPLYLKNLDEGLIGDKSSLHIEELQPHWMPEGNTFYKIEKPGQMDQLISILDSYNKPLFEGAAEGMNYIKSYEEHRT